MHCVTTTTTILIMRTIRVPTTTTTTIQIIVAITQPQRQRILYCGINCWNTFPLATFSFPHCMNRHKYCHTPVPLTFGYEFMFRSWYHQPQRHRPIWRATVVFVSGRPFVPIGQVKHWCWTTRSNTRCGIIRNVKNGSCYWWTFGIPT